MPTISLVVVIQSTTEANIECRPVVADFENEGGGGGWVLLGQILYYTKRDMIQATWHDN